AVDQQRVEAAVDSPRVDLEDLAADRDAEPSVLPVYLYVGGAAGGCRDPPGHRDLHPDCVASRQASSAGGGTGAPPRPGSASTAATMASASADVSGAVSSGMIRSRRAVDSRPARNSAWATSRLSKGIVVRIPATRYSPSARDIRAIAASRSAPQTISLA